VARSAVTPPAIPAARVRGPVAAGVRVRVAAPAFQTPTWAGRGWRRGDASGQRPSLRARGSYLWETPEFPGF